MKMKIKKQYLNEETLCSYGFISKKMFNNLVEWWKHSDYSCIYIHCSGDILMFIDRPYTTALIDDVIYRLIMDGLVETEE